MLATVLTDNRRAAYRVRPIATDNLALALLCNDVRHVPREVADVTSKGASVRFAKGSGPAVTKGQPIDVAIESPNLLDTAKISAEVVFTGESTTERLIGLAFTATDGFSRRVSEDFFQLFNRRAAYRDDMPKPVFNLDAAVMPLPSAKVNDLAFPVYVRNISTTGICLVVNDEADRFLRERGQVRLALKLPASDHAGEIVTKVCYRTTSDQRIYYGCHFDWMETPDAQRILGELTEYTHDRFDIPPVAVSQ